MLKKLGKIRLQIAPVKCKSMAVQDIEMNNFALVMDALYVYGELADGSQVKIKKSDLFSRLFQDRGYVSDYNKTIDTGIYEIHSNVAVPQNGPSNAPNYGILIVFKTNDGFILQILADTIAYSLSSRTRTESAWNLWKKISFTG